MAESAILEVRPSWWRYGWHLAFAWTIVPLIIAVIRRNSLVLRLYGDRINLEVGWLSKRYQDIYITDMRSIEVRQSFWQRLVNIGRLEIDTTGAVDDVLVADGIPDPLGVRNKIQSLRRGTDATPD